MSNAYWLATATDTIDTILMSLDGETWTVRETITDFGRVSQPIWNGKRWVAPGANAFGVQTLCSSTNGIDWDWDSSPFDGTDTSASWVGTSGGLWTVGGGTLGEINLSALYSTDGLTWNVGTTPWQGYVSPFSTTFMEPLYLYNLGLWVAVGYSGNFEAQYALHSTDGVTWQSAITQPTASGVFDGPYYPTYNGSICIAALPFAPIEGTSGITATTDGLNWTTVLPFEQVVWAMAWGNGRFLVSIDGPSLLSSTDGITWTTLPPPFPGWLPVALVWGGNQWVAIGSTEVPSGPIIATSPDALTWTLQSSPWDNTSPFVGSFYLAYGGKTTAAPIRQSPRDDDLALGTTRQRIGPANPSSVQNSYRQGFNGTYV